jgi:outer membrane murein-binding lipoprotein Lpp
MARLDPLGPTARCPCAGCCEACGAASALEVAIYETPVGVFCATVCGSCVAAGTAPPVRSWGQAVWRVGAHCEHLGIDVDQMAALLQAEREEATW